MDGSHGGGERGQEGLSIPRLSSTPAAPCLDSSEEESWGWTLWTAWVPHPPLAVCVEAPRGWEMGCCKWDQRLNFLTNPHAFVGLHSSYLLIMQ